MPALLLNLQRLHPPLSARVPGSVETTRKALPRHPLLTHCIHPPPATAPTLLGKNLLCFQQNSPLSLPHQLSFPLLIIPPAISPISSQKPKPKSSGSLIPFQLPLYFFEGIVYIHHLYLLHSHSLSCECFLSTPANAFYQGHSELHTVPVVNSWPLSQHSLIFFPSSSFGSGTSFLLTASPSPLLLSPHPPKLL